MKLAEIVKILEKFFGNLLLIFETESVAEILIELKTEFWSLMKIKKNIHFNQDHKFWS